MVSRAPGASSPRVRRWVLNSSFHDNQEGILGASNPNGHIVIRDSSFVHNGAGDGQSHRVYVGQIASNVSDHAAKGRFSWKF